MSLVNPTTFEEWIESVVEGIGYSSGIPQKLLGDVPTINQFIDLTKGDITMRCGLYVVRSLYSVHPFEKLIEYSATPNGILVPVFGKRIKFVETLDKITRKEHDTLDRQALKAELSEVAEHRRLKLGLLYNRNGIVNLSSL